MPRYFFDIFVNGRRTRDDEGSEFRSAEDVRKEAMHVLPAIAKDEVAKDGDQQAYMVLVTNEVGRPIYSATLTYAGLWLDQ